MTKRETLEMLMNDNRYMINRLGEKVSWKNCDNRDQCAILILIESHSAWISDFIKEQNRTGLNLIEKKATSIFKDVLERIKSL